MTQASTVTVLGAGAMGSAICTPLAEAGWQVRLWGTWLDDHLLDAVESGRPHPRTDVLLPESVQRYRSDELESAVAGADLVVMSVASPGVPEVTRLAMAAGAGAASAMLLTSKGFCPDDDGSIQLLPEAIRRIGGDEVPPLVAVAGPVKANECAQGLPTATVFACRDLAVGQRYADSIRTTRYAIEAGDDEVGVEVCAPMKNVYAIALGVADGLEEATGIPHHNLKAATFTRAVREMSLLGEALGAKPQTAYGLAGVGDLEVTGLSGRNKVYGVRIGRGEHARAALAEMGRLEQTVEGVNAAGLARALVDRRAPALAGELRLLDAVVAILDGADDPGGLVAEAALPR